MPSIDRFRDAAARGSTTALTELAMTIVLVVAILVAGIVLFDILWAGLDLVARILRFLPGVQPP
ncbi:MAG TPA: hypothetical protein VJ898_03905 [Natrialbaceae archaeon]|nr:hypothetical protein [Natrialbaceae archaeon]